MPTAIVPSSMLAAISVQAEGSSRASSTAWLAASNACTKARFVGCPFWFASIRDSTAVSAATNEATSEPSAVVTPSATASMAAWRPSSRTARHMASWFVLCR